MASLRTLLAGLLSGQPRNWSQTKILCLCVVEGCNLMGNLKLVLHSLMPEVRKCTGQPHSHSTGLTHVEGGHVETHDEGRKARCIDEISVTIYYKRNFQSYSLASTATFNRSSPRISG